MIGAIDALFTVLENGPLRDSIGSCFKLAFKLPEHVNLLLIASMTQSGVVQRPLGFSSSYLVRHTPICISTIDTSVA